MYCPKAFALTDREAIEQFIRARSFATLITPGDTGPNVNHLPFVVKRDDSGTLILEGHLARGNPAWQGMSGQSATVVFNGPDSYISPNWYPSKRDNGKVVPTWNYLAVHVKGSLRLMADTAWLQAHIRELTDWHEAGEPEPWSVDDAPAEFVDKLTAAIVGIELTVSEVIGKNKASQNQSEENKKGVLAALQSRGRSDMVDLHRGSLS